MMYMANIKGVALIGRISMIKEGWGQDTLNDILAETSERSRTVLNGALLSSSWYPAEVMKELSQATYRVMKDREPLIMQKLGAMTAQMGLTGVYKTKVKENRPEDTLSRVPSLWSAFHDTGDIEIFSESPTCFVMRLSNYALPHREFCDHLLGWACTLIELSGGTGVKAEERKCACKGDPYCEIAVTWC